MSQQEEIDTGESIAIGIGIGVIIFILSGAIVICYCYTKYRSTIRSTEQNMRDNIDNCDKDKAEQKMNESNTDYVNSDFSEIKTCIKFNTNT